MEGLSDFINEIGKVFDFESGIADIITDEQRNQVELMLRQIVESALKVALSGFLNTCIANRGKVDSD